jgi:hypothetical protein
LIDSVNPDSSANQEAKQSVPECERLVSAVHGLAEGGYTRRAYRGLEWQQI